MIIGQGPFTYLIQYQKDGPWYIHAKVWESSYVAKANLPNVAKRYRAKTLKLVKLEVGAELDIFDAEALRQGLDKLVDDAAKT